MQNHRLSLLIDALKSLPTIGSKAAEKIAIFLIENDEYYVDNFVKRIYDAKQNLGWCQKCNYLADKSKQWICEICANPERNQNQICVVSSILDVAKFENAKIFQGLYYVLHGEIIHKKKVSLQSLKVKKLITHIESLKNQPLEIILATNPTLEGEITAKTIYDLLIEINPNLNFYRIGFGLPYNCQINYADDFSLEQSLANKQKIKY